jgi:ATP-dependent Clp endopeptidase proteolytic subunit ClpP
MWQPFFLNEVKMKTWYSIKAQSESEALIDIFDVIGFWGISAQDFIADLKRLGDSISQIRVRINSEGGEVFDGIAIYNALKRHPANVTVEVYGIAASIASIIAMAGDKVIMPSNTFMFIHDPLAIVVGDATDMRDMADSLEKIAAALQSTYMVKTGKGEKEVKKWMNEDTWFSAQEALDAGLADEMTAAVQMAARANLARFKNLPEALKPLAIDGSSPSASAPNSGAGALPPAPQPTDNPRNRIELVEPDAETIRTEAAEIVKLCNENGLSEMAVEFFAKGARLSDVQKRFEHAAEIRTRCVAAGMPERAPKFIAAALTPAEVSDHLLKIKAALDPTEIDNKQRPEAQTGAGKQKVELDQAAIYAKRNAKIVFGK